MGLRAVPQTLSFKALTAKAFTTVLAGLALTTHILPKISFLPALVAGFRRVLTITNPGIVNFPALFNCSAAMVARPSTHAAACFLSISADAASASAKAPLVMTGPAFIPFIAFIAFMGAILKVNLRRHGQQWGALIR